MAAKFEIKNTESGKFVFNLKAGNGEIILVSQKYQTKAAAEQGIQSVKQNAKVTERFERKTSSNGQPFFNLLAENKQVIGTSEMYSSPAGMENGIASVSKNAPDAEIQDLVLVKML